MRRRPRAVVFDLDGVLVDSAKIHARAWKRAFDRFFEDRAIDDVFDEVADYREHVDGRPRYQGVAALLRSRQIELPPGDPDDEPGFATETAIGNLKNQIFHEILTSEGVEALPGALDLLEALSGRGVPVALVSSSRNARRVLPESMARHVGVILDGDDVAGLGIPGKPDPAMFIEGARRLGAKPAESAVVEDAPAGVRAGRAGGFAVVVAIDPGGATGLRESGADVVVGGVSALPTDVSAWSGLLDTPRRALDSLDLIMARLGERPAVFLDYDGTMTPIVDDPAAATIGDDERAIIRQLAVKVPVAMVSGRGLDDVRSMVAVEGLTYSGSHGFEIERADGERFEQEEAAAIMPQLDAAEEELLSGSSALTGVAVERKPYAIAVHTRQAGSDQIRTRAASLAREVAARFDGLVVRGGKEVHELRPAIDWDKGAALRHLLTLIPGDPMPLYIGDDETDEDAFWAVRRGMGVGILVGDVAGEDTWADFTLAHPRETLQFLSRLAAALDR